MYVARVTSSTTDLDDLPLRGYDGEDLLVVFLVELHILGVVKHTQ